MKQILLVDDDERIRETVAGFFERSDVDLVSVSNGNDALAIMAGGRIDLIITDLFMATLNGIELIGRIRRLDPAVPVVLITGGAEDYPFGSTGLQSLTEIAKVLGVCHVLYKPFRRAELLSLINGVLDPGGQAEQGTPAVAAAAMSAKPHRSG
ncbi:MAG: response regulator [Pararhodobacter sp.]|nr:response regulator [Pararhodobacter sp.]